MSDPLTIIAVGILEESITGLILYFVLRWVLTNQARQIRDMAQQFGGQLRLLTMVVLSTQETVMSHTMTLRGISSDAGDDLDARIRGVKAMQDQYGRQLDLIKEALPAAGGTVRL